MSATTTVQGRLGRDPEIRYTPGGNPVVEASLCATPRKRDRATGQWLAENARQGDQVAALGTLACEAFTRADGTPGSALVLRHPRLLGVVPRRSHAPNHSQDQFSAPNRHEARHGYHSDTKGPQNASQSFGQSAPTQPPF